MDDRVIASTVYDLTITAELLEDGTVRIQWATGQPGHVGLVFDDGDSVNLDLLYAWVESHTASQLAKLADRGAIHVPAAEYHDGTSPESRYER